MSTYQELKGLKVKYLSSDTSGDRIKEGEVFYNSSDQKLKLFASSAAWHSSGDLNNARGNGGSAGTATSAFVASGYDTTAVSNTEEYNGTGFTIGANVNTARPQTAGAGTATAGLIAGGFEPPSTGKTEEYNGTSWSEQNDMNVERRTISGTAGTQTAALYFGGYRDITPTPNGAMNSTESYNGTSWSNEPALNTAVWGNTGDGTQTAAVSAGGPPTQTEHYDGSSWTTDAAINTAKIYSAAAGTTSNILIYGGTTDGGDTGLTGTTELYDGTSWTETADMAVARRGLGKAGSYNNAVAMGGLGPAKANTEEFTISLTATTGASYSSGGNTNNARRNAGCMGTQTAGLYAGGFGPPYLNYSEEYNGTSWTEGNNLTIVRECSTSGFGTQTAGAVAGGGAPDQPATGYSDSTDEYDGTSWSEGGDINSARLGMATCGTQTAGFGAGGYQGANHPESPPSNTTKCEQYDGTSWTEVADLNTARSSMGHFGTQTASIACRGSSNPTESWDGSSWTNLSASPIVFNGGNHGGGTQTAGITYGPRSGDYTELWDGTTWASSIKYSTSRGGNCAGDASAGLLCGGFTGSGNSNATEEYTGETTAARAVKSIDFD
jgi:hypothetical protein